MQTPEAPLLSDLLPGIARALNDAHVPCPSRADAERNSHRCGEAWTASTVVAILGNPRYTGHQVWNRQRTDHDPLHAQTGYDHEDVPDDNRDTGQHHGHLRVQHWNPTQDWVISTRVAHPALVSQADFLAVQGLRAARSNADGATRTYLLASLLQCSLCGRRMDSHWVNNRPGYRCRHGHTSTRSAATEHPPYLYIREDELLADLHAWLPQAQRHDPCELAALLRLNAITISCDHTTRTLHPRQTTRCTPSATVLRSHAGPWGNCVSET
jgi:site-specific DNA recombinase